MAVGQQKMCWLNHCYREQAPSHSFYCIPNSAHKKTPTLE